MKTVHRNYLTGVTHMFSESRPDLNALRPLALSLDQIESRPVRWLWPGLVPCGKLVVLAGDPGLGKSFITLEIAARTSRGGPWPALDVLSDEGAARAEPVEPAPSPSPLPASVVEGPGDAILLSAEDDPADTIRPRLEAMGADLARIVIMEGVQDGRDTCYDFVIGQHVRELEQLIKSRPDTRLLVVDPISAYVGGTDSYNNAQVRAMLKPLSDLAADYGIAVVLVTHLRKAEAARLLQKTMGSLAFTAAARVVLVVMRDRQDPDTRLLLTAKSNVGGDRRGLSYSIRSGRVAWGPVVEGVAEDVAAAGSGGAGRTTLWDHFAQQLRAAIDDAGGSLPTKTVEDMAHAAGLPKTFAQRPGFKQAHGFGSRRDGTTWAWTNEGKR
ncbi:MAG: AAA family ATPase [Phycisphaerales bacterium]